MKITVGQLKKVIHSQLAEAKTAKQGETKRLVSESDYLRNKSPRRYDSNSKFSTFNNEPGDELMSGQTGSTPKYSGYILIKYENGLDTMIVKSPDDGNMERWVAGPSGHSGYTIFANNRQYEFTDTVKESIIGKKSISTEAKTAKQGEVKKINEVTFTKLIKKLIVEESNDIKGIKLNESITEANTGSESIADKLFRQCMMYPDIIDPIQRIEIFGIIAKKLQDHALLLSKKYARDAKI